MMIRIRFILAISLICCVLTAAAQPNLVFRRGEWDFGTIAEDGGAVSHTFVCENRGDAPGMILEVVASCGCTTPEFSRQPILPGDSAAVVVTYEPLNRPGTFVKELGVYDATRERVATLTLRGEVTPRVRSAEELYPFEVGRGLRLRMNAHAFTYIYHDIPAQTSIGYVNTSDRPLSLTIRTQGSRYLTVDYPRRIEPGEEGEINLRYAIPAESGVYGTQQNRLSFLVDGRNTQTPFFVHGIAVENFDSVDDLHAPHAECDPSFLRFDVLTRDSGVRQQRVALRNTGTAPLTVRAVETGAEAIASTLRPGTTIPAGGMREFDVSLDPAKGDYGALVSYLTIIVNDPDRPMRKIRISAVIRE